MNVESTDPNEIGTPGEFDGSEFDEDVDDDEAEPLDRNEIRERPVQRDVDEVEADGLLQLDRKELNELGLELDNPDGFADE
jgi:hypothetical protein